MPPIFQPAHLAHNPLQAFRPLVGISDQGFFHFMSPFLKMHTCASETIMIPLRAQGKVSQRSDAKGPSWISLVSCDSTWSQLCQSLSCSFVVSPHATTLQQAKCTVTARNQPNALFGTSTHAKQQHLNGHQPCSLHQPTVVTHDLLTHQTEDSNSIHTCPELV